MARIRGHSPRGERLRSPVSHDHRKTTTRVTVLLLSGIAAPFVLDRPINRDGLQAYVERVLVLERTPSDIVTIDNLGSRKGRAVRAATEAAGVRLLFVPPYSPDSNPIKIAFFKLKALLCKAAERTVEGLWSPIGQLTDIVTPDESPNFFAAARYDLDRTENTRAATIRGRDLNIYLGNRRQHAKYSDKKNSMVCAVRETRRISALLRSGLLQIQCDETLVSLVDAAADRLRAPFSNISLIGGEQQTCITRSGMSVHSLPRNGLFCMHTVDLNEVVVIPDTLHDPRWCTNSLVVGEPYIRFYAGIPILFENQPIGAFCVLDTEPREGLTREQHLHLERYATLATELLELRALRIQRQTEVVRFKQMAQTSPDPMLVADAQGHILYWNPSGAKLLGYSLAEASHLRISDLVPEVSLASADGLRSWVDRALGKVREIDIIDRDRAIRRMEVAVSRWLEADEPVYGAVLRDVSERHERENALQNLADHDSLTGLPNRSLLRKRIEAWLAKGPVSVLLIDLDGFKDVNDTIGHAAGDEVLRGAADRLRDCVRPDDIVARIGGDEFVVALPSCGDALAASGVAKRIVDAIELPFVLNERVVSIGASVGIALAPSQAEGVDDLLFCADLAVYKAKRDGRHRYRLYTASLRAAVSQRQRFVHEFHRAVERREFVLHYQPQVRLRDGALVGAEALIRWQHPEHGLLQPAAFLPALLSSRHSVAVNDWVMWTACRQAAAWLPMTGDQFRIGVNACATRLHSGEIAGLTGEVLAGTGLPPSNLELEITETVVLGKEGASLAELRALREQGVGIAFDDFGTGYASLSLLEDFPLTRLKIDRSFVQKMNDRPDVPVIRAILQLAKGFGLDVVAEGIETKDQMHRLHRKGCTEGQGYLFSQPVPAQVFAEKFIAEDQSWGELRENAWSRRFPG